MHSHSIIIILLIGYVANVLAVYDEKLAREKLLPLSSAAYSSKPEDCVQSAFSDGVISKQVIVECGAGVGEKSTICSGFVGYSNKEKTIFLVYRGTSNTTQLFYLIYTTISEPKVRSPIGGFINKYFHDAYSTINAPDQLGNTIKSLLKRYPDYKVWVTGHSLGGALASIAAGELVGVQKVPSNRVIMINFGQPRVGNAEYVQAYDKLLPNAYRIVNSNDLVPHVPPSMFDGYKHASKQIWYQNTMKPGSTYVECESEQDAKCSDIQYVYSITNHLNYFQIRVVLYGYKGCKTLNFEEFVKH